jgi:hypothetical protein
VIRGFAFGDLGIVVESVNRDHQTWLGEFLEPHFEPGTTAAHTWRIGVVEDHGRYLAALDAGPDAGSLDAFALDAGPLSLPRWRGADTRLFDAKRQLFYEIDARSLDVTILSAPGNAQVRSALMSVARELATNHAQRAGGLLLHASAFSAGGRAVLVAGPKRAGKTTMLVHAMRTGTLQYMANDRVMVWPGVPIRSRGVPTVVRRRAGTLDLFPALADRLRGAANDYRLTLDEAAAGSPAEARSGARRLSAAQFCHVLGVTACAEGETAAVIFPQITGEADGGISLHRLTRAEVGARLEATVFGARSGRWTSDAFSSLDGPPPPDRDAIVRRCRVLADGVPGFECRLGSTAYENPHATTHLLAALHS